MSEESSSNLPDKDPIIKINPKSRKPANPPSSSITATTFSGPLPPPALLQGYEQACPGAADRIIKMAEQEAQHRRATETAIVHAEMESSRREFAEAKRGQFCALSVVLICTAGCIYLGVNGHEIAASALGLGAIGSIVTTFITGRHSSIQKESHSDVIPRNYEERE